MAGAPRVVHGDEKIGPQEREVVVAAAPVITSASASTPRKVRSMGPKAEAAAWFGEQTGRIAAIGAIEAAAALLAGGRGWW